MATLNKEITELDWSLYCNIFYHLQEGYYGTALTICDEELCKANDSRRLVLFRSIALIKLGNSFIFISLFRLFYKKAIICYFQQYLILRQQ